MGEFKLDEELGRGNYGAVKKVLHKPTNVIMAMKVCFLSFGWRHNAVTHVVRGSVHPTPPNFGRHTRRSWKPRHTVLFLNLSN